MVVEYFQGRVLVRAAKATMLHHAQIGNALSPQIQLHKVLFGLGIYHAFQNGFVCDGFKQTGGKFSAANQPDHFARIGLIDHGNRFAAGIAFVQLEGALQFIHSRPQRHRDALEPRRLTLCLPDRVASCLDRGKGFVATAAMGVVATGGHVVLQTGGLQRSRMESRNHKKDTDSLSTPLHHTDFISLGKPIQETPHTHFAMTHSIESRLRH